MTGRRGGNWQLLGLFVVVGVSLPLPVARGQEELPGRALYQNKCAYCHGASGEGTLEEYPHPLAGNRSLEALTKYVGKTMPADDPETLTAEEAATVSSYIHEAFYSKEAQERNTPRLELSRLTVRQYQNAAADLIGSFRWRRAWEGEQGLKGAYYKSRRFRSNERLIERTDPVIDFDWGVDSPDKDKFDAKEFSIQWQGSVRAPETGDYEFVVRTEHATRLYVNDGQTPLIDAWVKSGNDNEYRGSIQLLGGRAYPIRLEFSKATQGVQEQRFKDKVPEQKASMQLAWKPPHRAEELIPAHCLTPQEWPESFVVSAPFPPDDRSVGYERGTTISQAWEQATTDGAIETAAYVIGHLRELAGVREESSDREAKLKEFCGKFAERAFRRPLTEDQKALYVDKAFEESDDLDTAVKRVVLLVMKSPRFLYRELGGGGDAYDVASRLAFALWDSIPNDELQEAAAAGKLSNESEVREQAWRMLDDLRTRSKVREFLMQWLKVEQIPELSKDPTLFPDFNENVASDLRTSLDLFLEEVVWGSETSSYQDLILSKDLYLNDRLASYLGVQLPEGSGFRKVSVEDGQRAGVLTHPYLMTYFAYTATSSPIHRGVFLARSVLGRSLRPPPIAVAPLAPDLHEGLTTRERVSLQTSPEACMSCHSLINSLGFTLENYDPLGRFRQEERGKPVDTSGWYVNRFEEEEEFDGVGDLAQYVASSEEAQGTFVEQLFHYLVKQPIRAYGVEAPTRLKEAFASEGLNIKRLIVRIASETALGPKKPEA